MNYIWHYTTEDDLSVFTGKKRLLDIYESKLCIPLAMISLYGQKILNIFEGQLWSDLYIMAADWISTLHTKVLQLFLSGERNINRKASFDNQTHNGMETL